jgi:hypothetical protein
MKHFYLFGLLALFAVSLAAQDTTVRDSSWIVNRAGVFFQARQTVTTAGVETTTVTPIGDTSTTTRVFVTNIQNEAARMAGDANIVRQYRAGVTELIRFAREISVTINRTPLDSIAASQTNLYTPDFWDINGLGIRFRRTAAGLYQWRSDTTTTWRPFAFLGGIMRLNSLNGYTTDLYRLPSGNQFRSVNNQYSIKPKSQVAQRTAAAPVEEPETLLPPRQYYTLNSNGTISTESGAWRWNARAKKWVKI